MIRRQNITVIILIMILCVLFNSNVCISYGLFYSSPHSLDIKLSGDLSAQTIYYVGGSGPFNFSTIQEAINKASDHDKIIVYPGIYYEHLIVNKSLFLKGLDYNTTIIHGSDTGDVPCIKITHDDVIIDGFSIIWADWEYHEPGIKLYADNVIIRNNNISIHDKGIIVYASAQNATISHNIFYNNHESIWLWPPGSHRHIITNNIISHGDYGILLKSSHNSIIKNNSITTQSWGAMYLEDSKRNIIFGNMIAENSRGIIIQGLSIDNILYHNNFINNSINAVDNGDNQWDHGIIDGGNYWDEYKGEDIDHNGIGDSPFRISGGINYDYYPYMRINQWDEQPLKVTIDVPSQSFIKTPFFCKSTIFGGVPPYSWIWNINNDHIFSQNISYSFNTPGIYNISCMVTDSFQTTSSSFKTIEIYDKDTNPPYISILKPDSGIYYYNSLLIPFSYPVTIAIGSLILEVIAIDNESMISSLSLFIDGQCINNTKETSMQYLLSSENKGMITVLFTARDIAGNYMEKMMNIFKL